jgi:hypothetical protein
VSERNIASGSIVYGIIRSLQDLKILTYPNGNKKKKGGMEIIFDITCIATVEHILITQLSKINNILLGGNFGF